MRSSTGRMCAVGHAPRRRRLSSPSRGVSRGVPVGPNGDALCATTATGCAGDPHAATPTAATAAAPAPASGAPAADGGGGGGGGGAAAGSAPLLPLPFTSPSMRSVRSPHTAGRIARGAAAGDLDTLGTEEVGAAWAPIRWGGAAVL